MRERSQCLSEVRPTEHDESRCGDRERRSDRHQERHRERDAADEHRAGGVAVVLVGDAAEVRAPDVGDQADRDDE